MPIPFDIFLIGTLFFTFGLERFVEQSVRIGLSDFLSMIIFAVVFLSFFGSIVGKMPLLFVISSIVTFIVGFIMSGIENDAPYYLQSISDLKTKKYRELKS